MNYEDRDTYGIYKIDQSSPNDHDPRIGLAPSILGANTLIGSDVVNQRGEHVGDIKELMLGMQSGSVDFAVLSFGGFLSIGEKLFAVPWGALTLDTPNKRFILDVEKDRLMNAPGFTSDKWPDMTNKNWANDIHAYYGTAPNLYSALP